jgi:hypothetical protein
LKRKVSTECGTRRRWGCTWWRNRDDEGLHGILFILVCEGV